MSNGVQIWLQRSNSDKFQFPVNPEEIAIGQTFGWNTVTLTTLGEYIVGGTKKLDAISLSGFFPRFYNPGYCEYTNIPNPQILSDRLARWARNRSVLKLTVLGEFKYKADVVITGYQPKAQGGHKGDILFELTLHQHSAPQIRRTKTRRTQVKRPSANKRNTGGEWIHVVKRGDNLWNICLRYYRDGNRSWDLARKNNIRNPHLIHPNQRLRMWPR